MKVKALRKTSHSCAPRREACDVLRESSHSRDLGVAFPSLPWPQSVPVSFPHSGHLRARPSAPPGFGERPPSAPGAHRAAPSAGDKTFPCRKRRPSSSSGTAGPGRASPPSCARARHCSARSRGRCLKRDLVRRFLFLVPGRALGGAGTGKAPPLGCRTNTCPQQKEAQEQDVSVAFWFVWVFFFNKINVPFAVCEAPAS